MAMLRRIASWVGVGGPLLLAALSVLGAFVGPGRAGALFNCLPVLLFCIALAVVILMCLIFIPRLHRSPGLFAMHAAPLVLFAGAWAGSERAAPLWASMGGPRIPSGYMQVAEGSAENLLSNADLSRPIGELPFAVRLDQFITDFYPSSQTRWVPAPKRYDAYLTILPEGSKSGAEQVLLRVNDPVHYHDYQIYLVSHARDVRTNRPVVVLKIVSDRGLGLVYAAFVLGMLGIFSWAWVEPGLGRRAAHGAPG